MGRRIEGRRHSRVEILDDPPEVLFKKFGRPDGAGRLLVGTAFEDRVARIRASASAILRAKGLPDVSRVYFTRAEPDGWLAGPPRRDAVAMTNVDRYVRERGFARDSPEDLAARILVSIARMEGNPGLRQPVFELGELWTLLRVYVAEIAPGAKGGLRSARVKRARAVSWQQRIIDSVKRHIAAGRTDSNIGVLLASATGKAPGTVAAYAARVRREHRVQESPSSRGYAASARPVKT